MAYNNIKEKMRSIIREMVFQEMESKSKDDYVKERSLTPAEEKKKEELVKALKPKYGKTPKTYAIATAQAKKLAEDDEFNFDVEKEESKKEGEIFPPRFGINASSKFLAIVYKDGEVEDNKYFDSEEEAQSWIDNCCEEDLEERMLAFPARTRAPRHDYPVQGKHNKIEESKLSEELLEIMKDALEMEEKLAFTKKFDDNPALKGKQRFLPDKIQNYIVSASEEEENESNNIDEENEQNENFK